VRPFRVVVTSPLLDHDPCLLQAVGDLAVEQLVAELSVKALAVAVLPGAPGLDEQRLRADLREPVPDDLGRHLRAVV